MILKLLLLINNSRTDIINGLNASGNNSSEFSSQKAREDSEIIDL